MASGSSRFDHMQKVSTLMRRVACQLGGDEVLWGLVGLLHDVDYDVTLGGAGHGLVAASLLYGKLPLEGLDAIRRHDHRSGVEPVSDLDYALVLCDAVAVVLGVGDVSQGFDALLEEVSVEKPWLRGLSMGTRCMVGLI